MPKPPAGPSDPSSVPSGPGSASAASPASFEAALAELETIVSRMETGELPLEEALSAYRRGAQLLQFCQSVLRDAQQQVQVLEAGLLQDLADDDAAD